MSINILHLSDIQYGRHHVDRNMKRRPLYSENEYVSQLPKILADLDTFPDEVRPNYIVVTGDIAEWSLKSEYELAEQFLGGIARHLGIGRRYVAMVPGNHDVNRDLCQAARLQARAYEREDSFAPPYAEKFALYADFFERFYRDVQWPLHMEPYEFRSDRLFVNFFFPEQEIVFVGLNSCFDESEQEPHYGNITLGQLQEATSRVNTYDPNRRMLRIALMHHNFLRDSGYDNENLKDADELRPVFVKEGYHLILHGHQHVPRHDITGTGNITLHVLATGSAGLDGDTIPDNARRYQIICIEDNRVRVYRRLFDGQAIYTAGKGAWKADIAPGQQAMYDEFTIAHYHPTPHMSLNDRILAFLVSTSSLAHQVTLQEVYTHFNNGFSVSDILAALQNLHDQGIIRLDTHLDPGDTISIIQKYS